MTIKPAVPIVTAVCPECHTQRPVYHDKRHMTYIVRHEGKRGAWCAGSAKQVKK